MTLKVLWVGTKKFFKKYWTIFVSLLIGSLSLLIWLLPRKEKKPVVLRVKDTVAETHAKLAETEAKASLEIGKVQGREEEVKEQVEQIKKEPDSRKRHEALIELYKRTRNPNDSL